MFDRKSQNCSTDYVNEPAVYADMQSLGAVTERFPLRKEVRGGKRGISLVFQNGVLFPLPSAHAGLFFARNKFFFVNARADLRGRFYAAQINHGFDFCFSCGRKARAFQAVFHHPRQS